MKKIKERPHPKGFTPPPSLSRVSPERDLLRHIISIISGTVPVSFKVRKLSSLDIVRLAPGGVWSQWADDDRDRGMRLEAKLDELGLTPRSAKHSGFAYHLTDVIAAEKRLAEKEKQ